MSRHVTSEEALAAVESAMDGPFAWGTRDCCCAAFGAFKLLFGIDPWADLRGTYKTRREALKIIADAGGFVPLITRVCRAAGLVPLAGPAWPGDIGIVKITDTDGMVLPALAIRVGSMWAAKSPAGVTYMAGSGGVWRAE